MEDKPISDAKNDAHEAGGKLKRKEYASGNLPTFIDDKGWVTLNALTHILSKIPYEELERAKVELRKRRHRGD